MLITKEDILSTIEEYENSDFSANNAVNRYFTIDDSDYILPIKYIVKKTMEIQQINIDKNFTVDTAEHQLKQIFPSYKPIDIAKKMQY